MEGCIRAGVLGGEGSTACSNCELACQKARPSIWARTRRLTVENDGSCMEFRRSPFWYGGEWRRGLPFP